MKGAANSVMHRFSASLASTPSTSLRCGFPSSKSPQHIYILPRLDTKKISNGMCPMKASSEAVAEAERVRTVDGSGSTTLSDLVHGFLSEDVWGQTNKRVSYPKLGNDTETDVIVVGAGVAGLLTALQLSQAGNAHVLPCRASLEQVRPCYFAWHAQQAYVSCLSHAFSLEDMRTFRSVFIVLE